MRIIANDRSSLENRTKTNEEGIDKRVVHDDKNLIKNREKLTNHDAVIFSQLDEPEISFRKSEKRVNKKQKPIEEIKDYNDEQGNRHKETYQNGDLVKSEIQKNNGTKITKSYEDNKLTQKEKLYWDGSSYVEYYKEGQLIDTIDNRSDFNKIIDWLQDKLLNKKAEI